MSSRQEIRLHCTKGSQALQKAFIQLQSSLRIFVSDRHNLVAHVLELQLPLYVISCLMAAIQLKTIECRPFRMLSRPASLRCRITSKLTACHAYGCHSVAA